MKMKDTKKEKNGNRIINCGGVLHTYSTVAASVEGTVVFNEI